jgi:amino acid adenylation domain-containing protein/thioester reductase-like protein
MFAEPVRVLDLPTDHRRPTVVDYRGESAFFSLNDADSQGLARLAVLLDVTPFMVLMAALNVLLARYSSQGDIVVGAGVAGRSHADYHGTLGMFINVLPVRSYPRQDRPFSDFLRETKDRLLEMYDNQDYPFERLVEKLGQKRDSSRGALFDVALVFQNITLPSRLDVDGVSFTRRSVGADVARTDLLLDVEMPDGKLRIRWEYRTSLFTRATIEQMNAHFQNILRGVIAQPDLLLRDIQLLSPEEESKLVYEWNQTSAEYPRDKTLPELFEGAAAAFPDRIAVTSGERWMTYHELNARANRLARSLRDKGVRPGTIVALMLEHCPELIVAIFGILKAGGCYLPIRPDYPADRIRFMLEDSQAALLLTTPAHRAVSDGFRGEVLDLRDAALYATDDSNLAPAATPADLVYVIYTSGSTGKPKGVMLEHRNVVRLLVNDRYNKPGYFSFGEKDVWTLFHSFCFDFSVWEIFGALVYGARLVIVPPEERVNPAGFLELLKREKVTVLNQTPGAFYNLIAADLKGDDRGLCLRYVVFGGEALKPGMLREWHRKYPETRLINMYGITETTVHVTYKEITDTEIEENVSNIGTPIPTLVTYVLDKNHKLVPAGVPGEIGVGGAGLARGYLGQPQITAARFVDDPDRSGERLYLSGDLARMLSSGEIEYLGRIDFQVKIRGHRIELGEIETCLLKHPVVTDAVVIARDDRHGNKEIVAYVVLSEALPITALREHLFGLLPDYMLPSHFIKLDALPLTPNGKVNRAALPAPGETVDTGIEFMAPRNDAEAKVIAAWEKCLGIEKISVLDNFFTLGGHSLKAVAVVPELQKHFEVTVNDIFRHQTVERLAKNVKPRSDSLERQLGELKRLIPARRSSLAPGELRARLSVYQERNRQYDDLDLGGERAFRSVLLTGATGYLGAHLLHELLTTTSAVVYTIVRGIDDADAYDRLDLTLEDYFGRGFLARHKGRVRVWSGDLAAPRLGLKEGLWQELTSSADAVLHSAALVKHYGHREEFDRNNVEATRQLIALAETGAKKSFHHVSTLSVLMGHAPGKRHLIFTEDDLDLGQRSDNAYVATKVEAERLVLEARARGLAAQIFRVGNISVNSQTGSLQSNIKDNAFFLRLRALVSLGVVPTIDDEAEVSFVDKLAQAIRGLMGCGAIDRETFHLQNPHVVRLSEPLTSPELRLEMTALPLDAFIDFLLARYDHAASREDITNFLLHSGWMGLLATGPGRETAVTPFTILSGRTQSLLERLKFTWPEVTPRIFRRMVATSRVERVSAGRMRVPQASMPSAGERA